MDKSDQTRQADQGPGIFMMERSPLLQKAENFAKMLEQDNLRIQKLISEGRANEVLIEENNPEEDAIEMVVCGPIYEANIPTPLPLDDTEMPADGWKSATPHSKE